MSDEEKKEYEELKRLLYQGTLTQYGKRKLIEIFETQQREIKEYKTLLKRQEELEQEKEKLIKQGWLNE